MKFGHTIQAAAEQTPAWAPYLLDYKRLKTMLSAMDKACRSIWVEASQSPRRNSDGEAAAGTRAVSGVVTDLEIGFKSLLDEVGDVWEGADNCRGTVESAMCHCVLCAGPCVPFPFPLRSA